MSSTPNTIRHSLSLVLLPLLALTISACTRIRLTPEQALVNSLAEIVEANSFNATLDLSFERLPVRLPHFSKTYLAVTGHADLAYDQHNRKTGPSGSASITIQDEHGQKLQGELRVLGQVGYVRIDQLPTTHELDLSAFMGTAFYFPLTELQALLPKNQSLSPLERASLAQVLRETPDLFTNIADLGVESLDGQPTQHYRAQLNPDAINRLLAQLATLSGRPQQHPVVQTIESAPIELWISNKTGALVKLRGEFTQVAGRTGTLELTIHELDQRLTIEPLDKAVPLTFEELLKRLQPTSTKTEPSTESIDTQTSDEHLVAPNTDGGNTTTPYEPNVPFPVQ
ncbi:MAG: hypothetical protein U0517_01930 [Candidatus Andersenbacteria bacterium]